MSGTELVCGGEGGLCLSGGFAACFFEEGAPEGRIEEVEAGHWVQLEQPEVVNRLLVEFAEEVGGK